MLGELILAGRRPPRAVGAGEPADNPAQVGQRWTFLSGAGLGVLAWSGLASAALAWSQACFSRAQLGWPCSRAMAVWASCKVANSPAARRRFASSFRWRKLGRVGSVLGGSVLGGRERDGGVRDGGACDDSVRDC